MTIFHIYCDETGTENLNSVARVVGLMTSHSIWNERIVPDWKKVLNEAPGTRYWHMTSAHKGELVTNEPVPRKLERVEREKKEDALMGVLEKHAGNMVSLVIEMCMLDWRDHVKGKVKPRDKWVRSLGPTVQFMEHPVFVLMREMVRCAGPLGRKFNDHFYKGDPFSLWSAFEEDISKSALQFEMVVAVEMLRRMATEESRKEIGPILFVPGKGPLGFLPVQMADMYAWHVNRCGGVDDLPPQLRGIRSNARRMTGEKLDAIVLDLNSNDRLDLEGG